MSAARFHVSETNPNEQIGGGGCLCSPTKVADCKGPYAVFYGTETDSNISPHVVISLACAEAFVKAATPDATPKPKAKAKPAAKDVPVV